MSLIVLAEHFLPLLVELSIAQVQVEFIDSLSLSAGITGLVEKGLQLQEAGQSYQEIAAELRGMVSKFRNYILIGNLTQLYKGGRLSSATILFRKPP